MTGKIRRSLVLWPPGKWSLRRRREAMRPWAADAVRARYGEAAVGPVARLLSGESAGLRASRSPWGPNRLADYTEDPEQTAGAGA